jgi:hypothetical protein
MTAREHRAPSPALPRFAGAGVFVSRLIDEGVSRCAPQESFLPRFGAGVREGVSRRVASSLPRLRGRVREGARTP